MHKDEYRDVALDQFERERLSLRTLERIVVLAQESSDPEKRSERDGVQEAIDTIRKRQQSA